MENVVVMRICKSCNLEKELNEEIFYWSVGLKRWFTKCKICLIEERIKHIIIENGIEYQICTSNCERELELNEKNYPWEDKEKQKYKRICKICIAKYKSDHYQKNKEIIDQKNKQYTEEHKEEISAYWKEYKARPENKARRNENEKQRRKNDPVFRLRCNISKAVCAILSNQGKYKNNSILKYLPYTIEELKAHLENQFEPWMTWDNYGRYNPKKKTWQLDHIKPQYDYPYDSIERPNFIKCWALSNLRPLESIQNAIDGARKTRHKKNN